MLWLALLFATVPTVGPGEQSLRDRIAAIQVEEVCSRAKAGVSVAYGRVPRRERRKLLLRAYRTFKQGPGTLALRCGGPPSIEGGFSTTFLVVGRGKAELVRDQLDEQGRGTRETTSEPLDDLRLGVPAGNDEEPPFRVIEGEPSLDVNVCLLYLAPGAKHYVIIWSD